MTDHKRKKKGGGSKIFWSCFRSFAADEGLSSSDKSDGRDTKSGQLGKPVLIAVSGRKGGEFIPDVNLVNGDVAGGGVDGRCSAKRSSSSGRISRILKAVLFDTTMAKKIRRSSSKSSIDSDTSLSSISSEKIAKSSNDINACSRECTDMDDSSSRRSNLLSSSSPTSSVYCISSSSSNNSNSRSSSDQKTSSVSSNSSTLKKPNPINFGSRSYFDQKGSSRTDSLHLRGQASSKALSSAKPNPTNFASQLLYQKGPSRLDSLDSKNLVSSNSVPLTKPNPAKIKSGGNNWNVRLCLFVLLSLLVLVIWGRIFSILCTSIWFYFVPCRRIKPFYSVTNVTEPLDTDSEQYKKRVIMAGWLERNRNSVR